MAGTSYVFSVVLICMSSYLDWMLKLCIVHYFERLIYYFKTLKLLFITCILFVFDIFYLKHQFNRLKNLFQLNTLKEKQIYSYKVYKYLKLYMRSSAYTYEYNNSFQAVLKQIQWKFQF